MAECPTITVELVPYAAPVVFIVSPIMTQGCVVQNFSDGSSFCQAGVPVNASAFPLKANTNNDSSTSVDDHSHHEVLAQTLPSPKCRRRRRDKTTRAPNTFEARHVFPEAMCQELREKLKSSGDEKSEAILIVKAWTSYLSFDVAGCRVVQEALDIASLDEASEIASALRYQIRAAAVCPHANHVVQKVVELLPPSRAEFVVEELRDVVLEMASHSYACRILCRLVEHYAATPQTISLINDLLKHAGTLLNHVYGHYVLQLALEHGSHGQRRTIVTAILPRLWSAARQSHANHVLITALRFCCDADRDALVAGLLQGGKVALLAVHKHGCKVVQELLCVPEQEAKPVVAQLLRWEKQLEQSKYGMRVLRDLKSQQKR